MVLHIQFFFKKQGIVRENKISFLQQESIGREKLILHKGKERR